MDGVGNIYIFGGLANGTVSLGDFQVFFKMAPIIPTQTGVPSATYGHSCVFDVVSNQIII